MNFSVEVPGVFFNMFPLFSFFLHLLTMLCKITLENDSFRVLILMEKNSSDLQVTSRWSRTTGINFFCAQKKAQNLKIQKLDLKLKKYPLGVQECWMVTRSKFQELCMFCSSALTAFATDVAIMIMYENLLYYFKFTAWSMNKQAAFPFLGGRNGKSCQFLV